MKKWCLLFGGSVLLSLLIVISSFLSCVTASKWTQRTTLGNFEEGECSTCCSLEMSELGHYCRYSSHSCVHVVIASNDEYLVPLLASINSVQQSASNNTRVWFHLLVNEGESKWLESKLPTFLDLKKHAVEIVEWKPIEISQRIKVWGKDSLPMHSNIFNYARFYLPELFPELCIVVYLDPDTIVQADISELQTLFWIKAEQMNRVRGYSFTSAPQSSESRFKYYFAAVGSHASTPEQSSYEYLVKCKQKEIREVVTDCSKTFFNAGVFVTDLSRWREEKVTDQLEQWMMINREKPLWRWGSQAPLAVQFYGKWIELPMEWNFRHFRDIYKGIRSFDDIQTPKPQQGEPTDEDYQFEVDSNSDLSYKSWWTTKLSVMKILHFAGRRKPWIGKEYHKVPEPLRSIWCDYLPSIARTPRPDDRAESIDERIWACQPYPQSGLDFHFVSLIYR